MPDSLQNISIDPAIALELDRVEQVVMDRTQSTDAETSQAQPARREKTVSAAAPADTTATTARQHRTAIVITAHKEPQMPVSPRSVGNTATSWVILGLIALFLLVSMRYARNFKFLRYIGRQLVSRHPRRRMFDDTVRETSFLIFLNLLCIVSAGVLLFGGIELTHPALRTAPRWYAALGVVTATVGIYYIWQWAAYFIIGRTFATRADAASWMRGFSAGQGILGLVLFAPALVSIFYAGNLTVPVTIGAAAYVVARLLFIIKGIRIFSPHSSSWLPFFYYLCSVEIAPAVLLLTLSTRLCMAMAMQP